jgi:hypothetical protein
MVAKSCVCALSATLSVLSAFDRRRVEINRGRSHRDGDATNQKVVVGAGLGRLTPDSIVRRGARRIVSMKVRTISGSN